MSAHTPGPWKMVRLGGYTEIVGEHGMANWVPIARITGDDHDARLIAAAPALLEALEDLLVYDEGGSLFVKARAAIAQARGAHNG